MNRRIAIAIAIGVLASMIPLLFNAAQPSAFAQYLAFPGIMTIMLIWGPHGPVYSDAVAMAVVFGVNAIVYGLIAFGLLKLFGQRESKRE